MPSNPSLQLQERLPRLRQSVISPPASHVPVPVVAQLPTRAPPPTVPFLAHLPTRAPPPTVPFLAHLRFESFQALRCYSNPLLAVQSKPQELAFPDPPGPALGGVHLQ